MSIKPIETAYKNCRFRSRLEARWAVFFDAMGIQWEYEPEGYDLGRHGWYLPDFWLPQAEFHAEVKPSWSVIPESDLMKLCSFDNNPPGKSLGLILLVGAPSLWEVDPITPGMPKGQSSTWGLITRCLPVKDMRKIQSAITAALSARFEHGERP